jgi:hypothetical protein
MKESIDTIIAGKQKELEAYKRDMEAVRQRFIGASAIFIANWYTATAKQYAITSSENTLRLGKDKISSMKAKLKDLVANAEEIANEFLSDNSLWWHMNPAGKDGYASPYVQYGNNYPKVINKPIRKSLGKLGVVLEEYGYGVTTKAGCSTENLSVWNDKNVSPYPIIPVPYYPDSLDWSKDMQDIMRSYNEIYKQAYYAHSEIKRLCQSKIDMQSTDLWDSV